MKNPSDIILNEFTSINLRQLAHVPIIAVYDNPKDYPGKFVARLWDINKRATQYVMVKDSLESIQKNIPKTMVRLAPTPQDDPVLVETWI